MAQDAHNENALTVFNLSAPFHDSLRDEERIFTFFGKNVRIQQEWKEGGKGGTDVGFGASVYNCSIVLASYLESHPWEVRGKSCVELGCGPGLVSIAAALGGSKRSWATDGDVGSVALAAKNLSLNNLESNAVACKLYWGDREDLENMRGQLTQTSAIDTADVILASDVAALPYAAAHDSLVETMRLLCKPGGTVLLSYQRRHSSEQLFFDTLQKYFDVHQLPQEAVHADFHTLPICIYKATPLVCSSSPAAQLVATSAPQGRDSLDVFKAFYSPIPVDMRAEIAGLSPRVPDTELSESTSSPRSTASFEDKAQRRRARRCFPTMVTPRLVLREIREADATQFLLVRRQLEADPSVVDIWGSYPLTPGAGAQGGLAEAMTRVQRMATDREQLKGIRWGITERTSERVCQTLHDRRISEDFSLECECCGSAVNSNGPLLGSLGFWRLDCGQYSGEIGYELSPEHWGKGYMTEALRAVVHYGFNVLQLNSIEANIDSRNLQSRQVLQKVGFRQEAHFRNHYYHQGVFKDSVILRLLRSDFIFSK